MEYYHPGYIESKHEKTNVEWYKKNKCDLQFCINLENGDFIPCGGSGGSTLRHRNGKIVAESASHDTEIYGKKFTCCFVTGKGDCFKKIKVRRWSCCKKELTGSLGDMATIKGCTKIEAIK